MIVRGKQLILEGLDDVDDMDDDLQAYIFTLNPSSPTFSLSGNYQISLVQNSAQAILQRYHKHLDGSVR